MKSDHKHLYKDCFVQENVKYGHKPYTFYYLGGQCSICGKIQKKKWYIFKNDIPDAVKGLPLVIEQKETNND